MGRGSLVGRALDLRPEGPGSRVAADQRPPSTLRASGACKIRRRSSKLSMSKYLWGYFGKVMASPFSKVQNWRPIVPGSAFGLTPRPSEKAQCVARPTLNTSHPSIYMRMRHVQFTIFLGKKKK